MKAEEQQHLSSRRALVQSNLERLYTHIEADWNRQTTTRNWFVAVWLAVLVVIASEQVPLPALAAVFLACAPILSFWIFESLIQSFIVLHSERAKALENMLASDDFSQPLGREHFLLTGWYEMPQSVKIRALVRTLFKVDISSFIYGLALVASLLFVLALR